MGQAGDDDNDEPLAPRGDENSARRMRGAGGEDELCHAIEEIKRSLAAEQVHGAEDADVARALWLTEGFGRRLCLLAWPASNHSTVNCIALSVNCIGKGSADIVQMALNMACRVA
jgi:hypothetical protein